MLNEITYAPEAEPAMKLFCSSLMSVLLVSSFLIASVEVNTLNAKWMVRKNHFNARDANLQRVVGSDSHQRGYQALEKAS